MGVADLLMAILRPTPPAKPSFAALVKVVEQGTVCVLVHPPLGRTTVMRKKEEWLRASMVNLSARLVSKVTARRS
jgi:hypothetical protein